MSKKQIFRVVFLVLIFLLPAITHGQGTTTPCTPGYMKGNVPVTQIPDYEYTSKGFLRLHFHLNATRWKYNFARFWDYDKDCNWLIGGLGMLNQKNPYLWPSISHLVIEASDDPLRSGRARLDAYNGDTGEKLTVDLSTPLGQFLTSYGLTRPVHRFVFGNRYQVDDVTFDWELEEGDLFSTPALPFKIDPTRNPVLIVPGLLGTDIKKGDEKLWLDINRNATDIGDDFMDPLQMSDDLTPTVAGLTPGDLIKNPIPTLHFYDLIIEEFEKQGYVEGVNLFTFPYDWRFGATGVMNNGNTNVDLLRQKIQYIQNQSGSSRVDIVAHSTGGLIVKKYVIDNPDDHDIGKAVFVGVPNTGAPKALKVLLSGDGFGIPWLADHEMQKIAKNMPVAYELSPSETYYDTKGSYVKVINQGLLSASTTNLGFEEVNDFLIQDHSLNDKALTAGNALHTKTFDNFDMRTTGVDLYSINGCRAGTMGNIIEKRTRDIFGNTATTYELPKQVPGDGTVPLESATNLPVDATHRFFALEAKHAQMPSQDGIREQIVNLVSGSTLATDESLITDDISKCKLKGKAIAIYSPVNLIIADEAGHMARISDDGKSILNTIPNADFQVIGDHKFAFLPEYNGEVYRVTIDGTDTGTFTLTNTSIEDDIVIKTEVFEDLPVTESLLGEVLLNTGTTTLILDTDEVIQPTHVTYRDITPPEATIEFDPVNKDLKLSSSESVSISDVDSHVVLTDESSNTLDIEFSETNRKNALKASVQSLRYNNEVVSTSANVFIYSWKLNTSGDLASLKQEVKSRNDYTIKAIYDGVKTTITGTNQTGKISKIYDGLIVLKVSTNQGDLTWVY